MWVKNIKKLGLIFCVFCILNSMSCGYNVLKYKIDDNYTGPIVVFVYSDPKDAGDGNIVTIDKDGLGAVRSYQLNSKFTFVSAQTEKEIQIVSVGEEIEASDKERGVYSLVKRSASSTCSPDSLSMIVFFVGVKSDFENWSKSGLNELKYFEEEGIDWCNFYKSHLK